MPRRSVVVDVFTDRLAFGNPVAVVLDGDGLTTDQMQRLAHWMNLSETTFLVSVTDPAADYRVRIFTPTLELPFAGHPTLGSTAAWLDAGGVPTNPDRVVQECGAGLITVRIQGSQEFAFAAPPCLRTGPPSSDELHQAVSELGIDVGDVVDAEWIDNGPGWLGLLLGSVDDVLALRPGVVTMDLGVAALHSTGGPADLEVRAFFPNGSGTVEDPVTGSLQASLGQWLIRTGRIAAPYQARQGTAIGRAGMASITVDSTGQLWVGGSTVVAMRGTLDA